MPEISEQVVEQLAKLSQLLQEVLAAINPEEIEVPPDVQARVNEAVKKGVCLQGGELLANESRVSRGLCGKCYSRSMQRIKRHLVTEAALIRDGYMLQAVGKGGRKSEGQDPVADGC